MLIRSIVCLMFCLAIALVSCGKRSAEPLRQSGNPEKFDACQLLKDTEIEAIMGSPIKEAKSSSNSGQGMRTAQCFYVAAEFSKSVSLSVTSRDPGASGDVDVRGFWKETFGRNTEREKEREGDQEKKESLREQRREKGEEEGAPLRKIEGIGEEAYWSGTRVGGALYVLKGKAFIRLSVGGADTNEVRIEKTKKLAAKALERL
jgi:hypothetical protein